MDVALVRDIGSKALLAGAGALLLYWTITAVKLVLSARGINPLIKQFFTQVAAGRIDAAYLLTTKSYRQHVNRQQFIRFLAGLKLNRFRNLKFVSVESGIGWVPFMMEALDYQLVEIAEGRSFEKKPSEYFRSNFYACFWFEQGQAAADMMRKVGIDNVLFETDFPHPTGPATTITWPGLTAQHAF